MARVNPGASLPRGPSPLKRLPWLWYDLIVTRTAAPFWVPSVVLLALLVLGGLLVSAAGGQLREAVGEPRFWLGRAYPALCSLAIGYAPEAISRLIANLGPWLERPDDELAELQQEMSYDLTRFFWIGGMISAAVVFWFAFIDPADLNISMNRETFRNLQLFDLPFYTYFCGSATPVLTWSGGLLIRRLRSLHIKPGFILNGGKQTLSPFNQLLVVVWVACVLPMSLIVIVALAKGIGDVGAIVYSVVFLAASVVIVFLPQLLMSEWLHQLRDRDLAWLRRQVEETAAASDNKDAVEMQRALLRYNLLIFHIDQVRASSVTLIDLKFVIQVATSMTAILVANVLLRALLR